MSAIITIDGDKFTSLKQAAEFLEMTTYDLSGKLDTNDVTVIKGFKVQRITKRPKRTRGQIYCEKNNTIFKNAIELGKYLMIDNNIICKFLRETGKFIDKNGNTYIRLKEKSLIEHLAKQHNIIPEVLDKPLTIEPGKIIEEPKVEVKQEVMKENVSKNSTAELSRITKSFIDKGNYEVVGDLLKVLTKINCA